MAANLATEATRQKADSQLTSPRAYDVIIVGAGVIGAATARELSRFDVRVAVLEAGLDLACGATRANSGVVHAGFDPLPGTLKAKYNVAGAALYPQWQRELGFAYYKNGALVLAFDDEDRSAIEALLERARANGVEGASIIEQEELRALEPNVSREAIAALNVETSGICDPYGLTYAAAENAAENGVEFLFDRSVTGIGKTGDGFTVATADGEEFRAKAIVNCAGVHADDINNMVSARKLHIQPVKGEYLLYHNELAGTFNRTVFQAPRAQGKGVLVSPVVFGNIFIGPNAGPATGKDDLETTAEGQAEVIERARRTWPDASTERAIATYAGLRARDADGGGDFIIGEAPDAEGFFNVACIDSPGLASAPAIAEDVAGMVAARLAAGRRTDFNPQRTPAPLLAMMDEDAVEKLVAANPAYGIPVCKCCHVSEGEIVDALHRALPVLSLDALKWRTGATMGPCHGGRCTARIMEIVMRERGVDSPLIQKRLQGSNMVAPAQAESMSAAADLVANLDASFEREGIREAGAGTLCMTGTRPAGVYSAYESVALLAATGHLPGTDAIVWGTHDAALEAVGVLADAGVAIKLVVESSAAPQGSEKLVAALNDRGIPVRCNTAVSHIAGAHRIEGVVLVGPEKTETVPCDMLVASPLLVPEP